MHAFFHKSINYCKLQALDDCSSAHQRSSLEVMMKNPILESIRETRELLLAESGGTLTGLVDRLQAEERASGRIIRQTRRPNRGNGQAESVESPVDVSTAKVKRNS